MTTQKSVALLIETSNAYARGLLTGIVTYIHENHPWSIYLPEQDRGAAPPTWLKNWRGDGLIVRIETDAIARIVQKLNVPTIDVSAARHVPSIPWVETDDAAIANLAAEHFLERGFQQLAFCGEPEFNWSNWREEVFVRRIREAGRSCQIFHSRSKNQRGFSMNRERQRLKRWVQSLPRPIGVFACYDIKGQQILDVCRELEIRVPEEVALLGVDNDDVLCNLCTPPLSSIIPAATQTGHEAARLLGVLMNGGKIKDEAHLMKPLGVAVRQSTDVLAIDDPDVAAAVRFIRNHACEGINVQDVLQAVPVSRRILEARFHSVVGRSPHQEITRRRIERIRQLLIDTDLPLAKIALRTGYRNVEYMSVAFRKSVGVPPGQFRRES